MAPTFVVGWIVAGLALLALLAGAYLGRRLPQPLRRDLGLGVAGLFFAAVFVAPAGVAVTTLGALADRYAYLPLFGFALTIAIGLRRLLSWNGSPLLRATLLGLAALWGCLLVFVSARERPFWNDNGALYTHAVTVEPESPIAHYRLGVVHGGQRRWPEAAAAFARAATLKQGAMAEMAPPLDRVLNNLGVAYLNLGRSAEAEAAFRRAISETNNVSYRAWFNLAKVLRSRGDVSGSCHALREALGINPLYALARGDLERHCSGPAPRP